MAYGNYFQNQLPQGSWQNKDRRGTGAWSPWSQRQSRGPQHYLQRQQQQQDYMKRLLEGQGLDYDTEMASYNEDPNAWMQKNRWGPMNQSRFRRRGQTQNNKPGSGLSEGQRRRYFQSSDAVDDFFD